MMACSTASARPSSSAKNCTAVRDFNGPGPGARQLSLCAWRPVCSKPAPRSASRGPRFFGMKLNRDAADKGVWHPLAIEQLRDRSSEDLR